MSELIASSIGELSQITKEIKTRSQELFKLRKRKDDLEEKIIQFLIEKDKPGVKYKNIAIVSEEKVKRERRKKADKKQSCMNIFGHYGISNGEKIFNEISEAIKGSETTKKVLKITDIK